jgi:hypothetical protein
MDVGPAPVKTSSDVPLAVGVAIEPVAPEVLTVRVDALDAAARAFAICCATVRPAPELRVYVRVGLLPLPGTVTVAIVLSVLNRGRIPPDKAGT